MYLQRICKIKSLPHLGISNIQSIQDKELRHSLASGNQMCLEIIRQISQSTISVKFKADPGSSHRFNFSTTRLDVSPLDVTLG